MITLILAAGYNPEWIWPHYTKHTVPIGGIPLIVRTIQQLEKSLNSGLVKCNIVITQRKEIQNLVPSWFSPQNFETYSNTLLSTTELWDNDRVLILNGDVVFSDKAIKFVLDNSTSSPIFFSSCGYDIIGFTFSKEHYQSIQNAAFNIKGPWMSHFRDSLQKELGVTDYRIWHKTIPHDGITEDFDDVDNYERWLSSREWAQIGNPPKPPGPLICGMNREMIKDAIEKIRPWNYTIDFPFGLDTFELNNKDDELKLFLDSGCFSKPRYEKVWDCGASGGYFTQYLLKNKSDYVIPADKSQRRLVQLHLQKYLCGHNEKMPIPQHDLNLGFHYSQQDIDLILIRDVINYIIDYQKFFAEVSARVKSGGECVIRANKNLPVDRYLEEVGFNVRMLNYQDKIIWLGEKRED